MEEHRPPLATHQHPTNHPTQHPHEDTPNGNPTPEDLSTTTPKNRPFAVAT